MKKTNHRIKSVLVGRIKPTGQEQPGQTPRHGIMLFNNRMLIGQLDVIAITQGPKSGKLVREIKRPVEDGLKFRTLNKEWLKFRALEQAGKTQPLAGHLAWSHLNYASEIKPGQVWEHRKKTSFCRIRNVDNDHVTFQHDINGPCNKSKIRVFLKKWKRLDSPPKNTVEPQPAITDTLDTPDTPDTRPSAVDRKPGSENKSKKRKKRKIRIGDVWQTIERYWNKDTGRYQHHDVTVAYVHEDLVHYRFDRFSIIGLQVTTLAIFTRYFNFVKRSGYEDS